MSAVKAIASALFRPLPIASIALGLLSVWLIKSFVEGMLVFQDLWDVSRFAALLVGSMLAAAASAGVAEKLRRSGPDPTGVHGGLANVTRTLLALTVVGFLYCNVGPVRGVWHSIMRRAYTIGMARDLPVNASSSGSSSPR